MNTEHVEEHRKDGSLKYECTKKWLRKSQQHLYPKRIITEKGASLKVKFLKLVIII